MNRTALKRLERATAHLTCSACRRPFAPIPNPRPRKYQFTRNAARELAALLVPARVTCPGCNRIRFDIVHMPDDGKRRALTLLQAARGVAKREPGTPSRGQGNRDASRVGARQAETIRARLANMRNGLEPCHQLSKRFQAQ